jgi:serine/threonine protein kinase
LSTAPADGGLGQIQFPLASDSDGATARAYGVWVDEKEVSTRGLFIIDPDGVLQYAVVHNLNVGRNPDEVLRVLDALQTGGLCPASWTSAAGTIDPERALRLGTILGHYRIRAKLGSGTFGTVFAAWDLRLERMVALKILKRSIRESREAALTEARSAAKLNHPHVCTVYAVEEEDGLPMIAMEFVDGQPLSQTIEEGLRRDSALRFASQIALGLAAAHAQGVIHGDLKPANVIMSEQGIAKILDFGLAISQRTSVSSDMSVGERHASTAPPDVWQTADGVEATVEYSGSSPEKPTGIRGSLAYMSPEQARGLPATSASDVFSFGLTLVEMLTGARALREESPVKLLVRLQTEDLGSELANQVDEPFRELLPAMLAQDPVQRPPMTKVAGSLASIQTLWDSRQTTQF